MRKLHLALTIAGGVFGGLVVMAATTVVLLQPQREGYDDIVIPDPDGKLHVNDVVHAMEDYGSLFSSDAMNITKHLPSWTVTRVDGSKVELVRVADPTTWYDCIAKGGRQVRVPYAWIQQHLKQDDTDTSSPSC